MYTQNACYAVVQCLVLVLQMTFKDSESVTVALLGDNSDNSTTRCCNPDSAIWRFLHVFHFMLGGTTFIAGTACLFFPGYDALSAYLYTIGSCGFFFVDVQEMFTFSGPMLRTNIALAILGSFLYIVGSVGFIPQLNIPQVGVWGFIAGSLVIGCSQLWKGHRITTSADPDGRFNLKAVWKQLDAFTALGVELSACLGAWSFFVGTTLYRRGPLEGEDSVLLEVLWIWVAGSVFFTMGSIFLAYRHYVMGVV